MASVTRSNRRAEGLHPQHHNVTSSGPLTRSGPGTSPYLSNGNGPAAAVVGRTKRALDLPERDLEAVKPKKTRIAVEILAKPKSAFENHHAQHPPPPIPRQGSVASNNNSALHWEPTATAALSAKTTPARTPSGPHQYQHQQHDTATLTKHQAKVINGIKHELGRLHPQPIGDAKEPGRKLRSQEAVRFKSELSAYFPEYDEVIGNEPKEQHLINVETPIVVTDTRPPSNVQNPQRPAYAVPYPPFNHLSFSVRGYGDAIFTDVIDSQRIDFGFLEAQHNNKNSDDPLPDNLFEPVHRRAERLERSIRNTEKGRAQHEKDQIIRLLEALQSHDWLRVMGVSGVTETKKKTFEPARMHFIKGCQSILDKFRNWSLEEKRRKLERERALAEKAERDEVDDSLISQSGSDDISEIPDSDALEADEGAASSHDESSEEASPAKQLRQEARARARSNITSANSKKPRPVRKSTQHIKPPKPPEPPKEFKSFFTKKYERDSALNRHRRPGRKVLAWGHPIPEFLETDFILPEEYRDEETLKARARKKRRDRRESRQT